MHLDAFGSSLSFPRPSGRFLRMMVDILPDRSRQYRPGTITLSKQPDFMQSSPDGSAILVIETSEKEIFLRVFHEASFGSSSEGLVHPLPPSFRDLSSVIVTSFGIRSNVFLLGVNTTTQRIVSVSVRISRRETEFQFQASKGLPGSSLQPNPTAHNSLLDCLSEVWARYPVASAIQRSVGHTKVSA